jgi:hypothetical protein
MIVPSEKEYIEIDLDTLDKLEAFASENKWLLLCGEGEWDITRIYATPKGIEIFKAIRGDY